MLLLFIFARANIITCFFCIYDNKKDVIIILSFFNNLCNIIIILMFKLLVFNISLRHFHRNFQKRRLSIIILNIKTLFDYFSNSNLLL